MRRKNVLIMGAAGRDFHNFNVVFRDNEEYDVNCTIDVYWKNIPLHHLDPNVIFIDIKLLAWCQRGYRHEFVYSLLVDRKAVLYTHTHYNDIAPGVTLASRRSTRRSVRWLKVERWFKNKILRKSIKQYLKQDKRSKTT